MNKWLRLVARLYPASWRQRYGAEFDALLDDTRAGWRDVLNVFYGAMIMQVSINYRYMTLLCGLAGLIMATGLAFAIPNVYISRAVIHLSWDVINENASEAPLHGEDAWRKKLTEITAQAFSRPSLAEIIQRPNLDLYKKDRTAKPLEDVVAQMKDKDIRIEVRSNSTAMNIVVAFHYPDPALAQKTLQALTAKLADANQSLAIHATDRKSLASLDLLDPASLPKRPTYPNRLTIALLGLGAGILVGILVVIFRRKSASVRM